MTNTKEKKTDEKQTKERRATDELVRLSDVPNELSERGRQIWLAGLGALSRVEEEGERLFTDLINRGQALEDRGRKQIESALAQIMDQQKQATDAVDTATRSFSDVAETVERSVSDTFTDVLGRAGMPTREEVEELSTKVSELSDKLDALSEALDAPEDQVTVYHVAPHDGDWAVLREGGDTPEGVHETKQAALEAARAMAKEHAPSRLVIRKQDGSVQETREYDGSDA